MSLNQTELIHYVVDIQYEYNMKLITLGLLALYALFAIWYFNKYEPEYLYQFYFKTISLIFAKIYIVILPLWVFFLSRPVPIDVLLRPIVVTYSVAGLLFIAFMFIYGGERIKEFFTGERFYRNRK